MLTIFENASVVDVDTGELKPDCRIVLEDAIGLQFAGVHVHDRGVLQNGEHLLSSSLVQSVGIVPSGSGVPCR